MRYGNETLSWYVFMCLCALVQTLFVGVGADEQLAGYSRHRTKFRYMYTAVVQMYQCT
jgi:asparagine synthetase B (glutamine-hydrolysing)